MLVKELKRRILRGREVENIMGITALDARIITEAAKIPIDAWTKLFESIEETAQLGHSMLVFDEEDEKVVFEEHRKEVKKKLEELGYKVSYRRVRDNDNWYGETYHNCYVINW